ncbi:chemotaxis protein CheB [Gluconacetobacter sacchari]|uniref:chemotaxis protein CheB n=1 Tax=Gluconacetobacter sacchari TaxID=92759 RepID=UPI0039B46BE8
MDKPEKSEFTVVGLGASSGGLDACRKFLAALHDGKDLALILIQHLDPTHESLMASLLSGHTNLAVRQAEDNMIIAPGHLYLIPPGVYLSVADGALHLSEPLAQHGARLPFDFLLRSLARDYGPRAVAVILSGTGHDGAGGIEQVKAHGGFVVAQDPAEAAFDGMPRSAIDTGWVDVVSPVAEIPAVLAGRAGPLSAARDGGAEWLTSILAFLRTRGAHDFKLYKAGTLQRRIERRIAMAPQTGGDPARYLVLLHRDPQECDLLMHDLLINVTGFFRDPAVFDLLARTTIPDLIADHRVDQPIRIWVAGCSTGEEAYSLAILFTEALAIAGRATGVQVIASDIDADAIAIAREGVYSEEAVRTLPPERLARFFVKENRNWRVVPALRGIVLFTVQDVLADLPFSRIDLISCRNLLIYLRPEAQARIVSLFHFALREGGVLLLGSAERIAEEDTRFALISKAARLYRHLGRARPGDLDFAIGGGKGARPPMRAIGAAARARQSALADLCRAVIMDVHAPATVLVDRNDECVYALGPTERYLRVPSGAASRHILAMVLPAMRARLRSAIVQARRQGRRVTASGGGGTRDGNPFSLAFDIQPVEGAGESLLVVCFVETRRVDARAHPGGSSDSQRVAALEQELAATRAELQAALRDLEIVGEEQKTSDEVAKSTSEEYQTTNEDLLTSTEELQSLNEELTALNSQLQETLERQRTTANDLQNVLNSTEVATIVLDTELRIRFFTPATKSIFSVIPTDIGRPLADLRSLAPDNTLFGDARSVIITGQVLEQETETADTATWYRRRVLPYRTAENGIEGVVITFDDITARKRTADALEAARRAAELADLAKSRFLAAASHDLRQPLQSLMLIQGLLKRTVTGEKAALLVARLHETVSTMSGMLNALLDINQIETGTIPVSVAVFPVNDLLASLRAELTDLALIRHLRLRVSPSSAFVRSDPRLLGQMLRNLIANALKYTESGGVLVGCRREAGNLRIEVWDTGIGIPAGEFQSIFEEYHQLGNAARAHERGLGLGLSIVRRLGDLLGHPVRVRSHVGKGSVFSIAVPRATDPMLSAPAPRQGDGAEAAPAPAVNILIVEDDPDVRALLAQVLRAEGHRVTAVPDGRAALATVRRAGLGPDIVLADYNLPDGMSGIDTITQVTTLARRPVRSIILTGDISNATLREIAQHPCVRLNKPVEAFALLQAVRGLLSSGAPRQ